MQLSGSQVRILCMIESRKDSSRCPRRLFLRGTFLFLLERGRVGGNFCGTIR